MTGLIFIFVFVVLLAVPGFYIIMRKIFPQGSKKHARLLSYALAALLVAILAFTTLAKL